MQAQTIVVISARSNVGYTYKIALRGNMLHLSSILMGSARGRRNIKQVWCNTFFSTEGFTASTGQRFLQSPSVARWLVDGSVGGVSEEVEWPF